MRAACGCLVEDGMTMHGYDGPCALDEYGPTAPEPTAEDHCAAGGHVYYGDDAINGIAVGRCYCGAQTYPAGGAS